MVSNSEKTFAEGLEDARRVVTNMKSLGFIFQDAIHEQKKLIDWGFESGQGEEWFLKAAWTWGLLSLAWDEDRKDG